MQNNREICVDNIQCRVEELRALKVRRVEKADLADNNLWKDIMQKHHYLGCPQSIGSEIRYLIESEYGILGGLCFSSPAWRCKDRDDWIGWDEAERPQHLQRLVNNSRFLIMPHVQIVNLASKVLSMAARQIKQDWVACHGETPVALETFVDKKYIGTSYQAANWIKVGKTQGRGKRDRKHKAPVTVKDIYMFPLVANLQATLALKKKAMPTELDWTSTEFATFQVGDSRLRERLFIIGRDFLAKPDANIPQACGSRAKVKAAYRFFKHPKVKMQEMLESHYQSTKERIKKEKVVLAVQDSTSFNYSGHDDEDLGFIGDSVANTGIMVHDTLALNLEGTPLGLVDIQTWIREKSQFGKKKLRAKLGIEAKESGKWLKSYQALIPLQRELKKTMLVSVGDREADVFELFQLQRDTPNGPNLLVRAHHDRKLKQEQQKLWEKMAEVPAAGQMIVDVPRKPGKKKRTAVLDIHFSKIELSKKKEQLTVWAVYANETNPPAGVVPLSWMLLTTIEVATIESAMEKVKWYGIRWQIEVYHKIIKSGCRVENRQLATRQSLEACIALDLVIAWRIFYLTKVSRQDSQISCTVIFDEYEWKALVLFVKKPKELPKEPPTLLEAVHMVASLGGFLGRKSDGNPGSITLWRGLIRLADITQSYLLFSKGSSP